MILDGKLLAYRWLSKTFCSFGSLRIMPPALLRSIFSHVFNVIGFPTTVQFSQNYKRAQS